MTGKADIPKIERSAFFTGQRLTDNDLNELQRAQRELRWLHNRAVHAWGVGIGLAVTGESGDTSVTVESGYGTDCRGREVILTKARTITVPAVAGRSGGAEAVYYLVAAYQSNDDQAIAEQRPGICLPGGTVRLSDEASIEWKEPDQLLDGHELVLAQAWIQNCQLSRPLSLAPRRYARPAQQPYIAAGQTGIGETEWEPWEEGGNIRGVSTVVNTSAAKFTSTPNYIAHVTGDRYHLAEDGTEVLINGIASVIGAAPNEFTLRVRTHVERSSPLLGHLDLKKIVSERLRWHIVWMGIEG